jgi:LPS O-antigen subunit length determinant protein (WzzB/FepE family)
MSLTSNSENEINFKEIFNVIWSGKYLVISFFTFFSIASIFFALSLPDKYQSSSILMSTSQESEIGNMASSFSGIAGLAGVSLDSGDISKKDVGLQIIKSRSFITDFIERRGILIDLMASEGWDRNIDQVVINQNLYDSKSSKWVRKVSYPQTIKPSSQEAYDHWMNKIFSMSEDPETKFITISITHHSPNIAKNWANWLVNDINEYIRTTDVKESDLIIEYVESELKKNIPDELKSLLFNIISSKMEVKMLAFSRDQYLFKTLDSPIAPEKKISPNRAIICILITFLGSILGVIIVIFRFYSKNETIS